MQIDVKRYIILIFYRSKRFDNKNGIFYIIEDVLTEKMVDNGEIYSFKNFNDKVIDEQINIFMDLIFSEYDIYEVSANENEVSFYLKKLQFLNIKDAFNFIDTLKYRFLYKLNKENIDKKMSLLEIKLEGI